MQRRQWKWLGVVTLAVLGGCRGGSETDANEAESTNLGSGGAMERPRETGTATLSGGSNTGGAAIDQTPPSNDGGGIAPVWGAAGSSGARGSDGGSGPAVSRPGGHTGTGATGGLGQPSIGATGGLGQPSTDDGLGFRKGCKRGVAYGHHSPGDLEALSGGVSWWYNWDFLPESAIDISVRRAHEVEFVPMIWGAGSDRAAAETDIPTDAAILLGFNEPNFGAQANLSAAQAAALWPELESLAAARGLRLISPAVNFCGGDCQDTDPFNYLEEFFAACANCRVDAVAIHIYVGCNPPGENHAEWLINHVETYKERFSKPLWLTEFACDDATSEDQQRRFLEDAVAYLEAEPRIERYAWFSGRANNMTHVDLLGADGQLTELGTAYVSAPQSAACMR